jgi:hypothetical protein
MELKCFHISSIEPSAPSLVTLLVLWLVRF